MCYRAYLIQNWQTLLLCESCDTLVYDGNNWVLLGSNSTVGLTEVPLSPVDNKTYDLLGREMKYVPSGMMYIRNQKLHMKK